MIGGAAIDTQSEELQQSAGSRRKGAPVAKGLSPWSPKLKVTGLTRTWPN
jgi:hypothetical protein